jgi:hypothetical protein
VAGGARPILVTTGKGAKTLAQLNKGEGGLPAPDSVPVMPDLAAAARYILAQD